MQKHPYIDRINRNDDCPCGSGRKFKKCWQRAGSMLHPLPVSLALPTQSTSAVNHKCALRNLNSCSSSLSVEHFISQSVQAELRGAIQAMATHSPDPSKLIAAFDHIVVDGARVLCGTHNTALSPLDVVGQRLAHGICAIACSLLGVTMGPTSQRFLLVNGHDIERYLLKMMIGAVAAGLAGVGDMSIRRGAVTADADAVAVLAGTKLFTRPNGLYVKASRDLGGGPVTERLPDLGIRPLFDPTSLDLVGLAFRLFGIDLVLWAHPSGALR